jgi:DNA invertase Pin-like site-specific DNA recombinase
MTIIQKLRCAVYTRKSSEEGLEQGFNSLDAQREACEAYVASQRSEGWLLVPDRYDDGGFSGGTLERPALKRLMADIALGKVDVVVVYKIDRLSRSLMDFSRLVEAFDRSRVTFVSVTQSFNTTTSMGRLTLNVLLSFAQFEREVTAERIRDKFAASRAKGMWMGGWAPLGYDVVNRRLEINGAEAAIVLRIFDRFAKLGSATKLVVELRDAGVLNKRGRPIEKGFIYKLLNNAVYIGDAVHKGKRFPGEHGAIVGRALWDKVQGVFAVSSRSRAAGSRAETPALLKGLLYTDGGSAMSPTHTRKGGRLYRYYVSQHVLKNGAGSSGVSRIPAGEIECAVVGQLRRLLAAPEIVAATSRHAQAQDAALTDNDVSAALQQFEFLWDALFPSEQARIVRLLVERVTVAAESIDVQLRVAGLANVVAELRAEPPRQAA